MAGDAKKDEAQGRTEALAALGEVAAGVTHEVRNVMTGVLGFTQVAKKRLHTQPDSVAELLELVEKESQRAVELLTNFLSFTRPRRRDKSLVAVADVVASVCKLMAHQLNMSRIKLECDLDADVPLVTADSGALRQVLLNLMINAMQAHKGGGGRVRVTAHKSGAGGAELRIEDDGPGVPADVAARIFEPFFTTKSENEGTGMGLAVSRAVVEEHGGTLTLEPSERGARFVVRLPAAKG